MPNLHSDKALELKEDDKLNRLAFAKRIADVIKKQTSKDCLVLGLPYWRECCAAGLRVAHSCLTFTNC